MYNRFQGALNLTRLMLREANLSDSYTSYRFCLSNTGFLEAEKAEKQTQFLVTKLTNSTGRNSAPSEIGSLAVASESAFVRASRFQLAFLDSRYTSLRVLFNML